MTSIDAFLPYIVYAVHACPQITIEQAIVRACNDFCRRTDVVQKILSPIDIVAGTSDYAVTTPTDMTLARVMGVAWQGKWLVPVPPDDVQSDVALRSATIGIAVPASGSPQFFFQKTTDLATVSLYPIPDTALSGGLFIKASFAPTLTALTVDDSLLNDWYEDIAAGALARLKAIPGQPWSADPARDAARFEHGVSNAKRQKMFGKLPSATRIQPRSFM